jgi:hypothetical protein
VAIYTRRIGVRAAELHDLNALELTSKFLNTYLRASINARDVRTTFHVMGEVRSLGETLLRTGKHDLVLQLARRLQGYGQLAFQQRLPFILETAAYDLSMLLELAHELKAPCADELLGIFLEVDREPDGGRVQEASLRGVRKAQVRLATCYLVSGDRLLARRIFEDMRHEDPSRLTGIRDEISSITERDYWEISDRGINFDYLEPARRAQLQTFFGWFDDKTTPV